MKLSLQNKIKKDIFIALFHLLKNGSSALKLIFNETHLYIQGMDKSHVCLFDIKISSSWFTSYEVLESDFKEISIDTNFFYTILSINQEHQTLVIHYSLEPEILNIDFINEQNLKGEFSRYFQMSLADLDIEQLHIPTVEYDAEFTVNSKKMSELISQLTLFGDTLDIKCSEETIDLIASGDIGKMLVNIPIDDLTEYGINEGEIIELSYSLNYIHKMCLTTKLATDVEFCISESYPMRIKYDLGEDSQIMFYLAPKIKD